MEQQQEQQCKQYPGGGGGTGNGYLMFRSKSMPQVIKMQQQQQQQQQQKLDDELLLDDSGVHSELCASLMEAAAAAAENGNGNNMEDSASMASEPPSEVEEQPARVVMVKHLVLSQIDKKLKELRTLKSHYYPEGGWGFVVLTAAFLAQMVAAGAQFGLASYLAGVTWAGPVHVGKRLLLPEVDACWLGALSVSVSLLASPLTIAVCRRKSTRLTAVMGGLVAALGCLFTSFASQFHQLFLSYGVMTGIGVALVRDPATLMVGQYFKRKREFVEIILVSGSGVGLAAMSVFIQISISNLGWRHGLQAVTGVLFLTFFLGTFYRSASLYHPQRRAILHLKSQKRKIKSKDKEKNKAQDDRPPYFDFATLKSRTVQILLVSIAIASFGLNVPIFFLAQQAFSEGIQGTSLLILQAYLGGAWTLGCWLFGILALSNSKECRVSKQYLCQAALFLCGVSILAFTAVEGYNGYVLFVWLYGIFLGGYNYALKMYIYEKVRARNFARAWGFAQFSMALPNLFGVPMAGYMNQGLSSSRRSGYYLSAACVMLGGLAMSLIDVHRKNLRKKHKLRREQSRKSNGSSVMTATTGHSVADPNVVLLPEHLSLQSHHSSSSHRRQSFGDQDDVMLPLSLGGGHQRSFTYDDLIDFRCNNKQELTLFSEEGIADMDLPDQLFLEELEYLDNITSCDKVENCVMLSEYEQNLIKETEGPMTMATRGRKWSLFRQASGLASEVSPEAAVKIRGGGGNGGRNRSSAREIPTFPNTAAWSSRLQMPNNNGPKRSITVIEEASV